MVVTDRTTSLSNELNTTLVGTLNVVTKGEGGLNDRQALEL